MKQPPFVDKLPRERTENERKAIDAETKRQAQLKRGWHAVKDFYLTNSDNAVWPWYVVYFKAKGVSVDASSIEVEGHRKWRAEACARKLNRLKAVVAFC